jgi:hypothetical protein
MQIGASWPSGRSACAGAGRAAMGCKPPSPKHPIQPENRGPHDSSHNTLARPSNVALS